MAAALGAAGPFGAGWNSSFSDKLTINQTSGTATVTQADGSTVPFTINGTSFVAPAWVSASLVQNSDGTYTYTLANQDSFRFDSNGRLMSEADRNGEATTAGYDAQGRLATITDGAGQTITLAYNSDGTVSTASDSSGRAVSYSYSAGNLVGVTNAGGGTWVFGYDGSHQLTSETDPRGHTVTTSYNASNQVTSQADPASRTRTWTYSPGETVIQNPDGTETDEHFNGQLLTSITHAYQTSLAATTSFAYDARGNTVAVTDPRGNVTSYLYDAAGNRTRTTDSLGRVTKWTYDSLNDVTSTTNPAGVTTTYSYDSHGNVLSVATPLAGTNQTRKTTYTRANASHPGDVTAVTDPDGHITSYGYDAAGDLTSVTDPLGNETTYGYDSIGRRTSMVSPSGNATGANPGSFTTSYTYDALSRMTSETDPLGHSQSWSYDGDGNVASRTDQSHNTTTYSYDADNELTKITRPDTTTLQSGYDANGNLTSQTDGAGHTTTYGYDALERVTSVTTPLGKTTSYGYDPNGNRTTVTDPDGRVTTDAYDAANQLTGVTYSDGQTPNVTYSYTPDGRRASMVDGTGTTSYTYDGLDRLQSTTNGAGSVMSYGRDLAGNITSITYPGGHTVTRTFDADERIATLTDWKANTTTFSYDPNSNLQSTTYPDSPGTVDSIAHDQADRISSITSMQGSSTLLSIAYTRNADGQVLSETDAGLPAPSSQTYTYNSLGQLASATSPGAYTYDAADSPILQHGSSYSYNAGNELTTSGGSAWTFNNEGQRTADNWTTTTMSYGYDQAGNITSISEPAYGSTSAINNTYAYDGDGNRVSLNQSGSPHVFTWDVSGGLPLLACENSSCYIYGPGDRPLEMIDGNGNPTFFHLDKQGSVRMITKPSGQNVGAYTYDPYGRILTQTGSAFTRLEYDGEWYESVSGLFNLMARNYDPKTGQFMSRDPLNAVTRQPYLYAGGDPVNATDPTGLSCGDSFSPGDLLDCVNPVSSGNLAYQGAQAFSNATGIDVTGAAGSAAGFVVHHYGQIGEGLAATACLTEVVGPVSCLLLTGGAFGASIYQTVSDNCLSSSQKAAGVLLDALGTVPGAQAAGLEAGGLLAEGAGKTAMKVLAGVVGGSAIVGGPAIVSSAASGSSQGCGCS